MKSKVYVVVIGNRQQRSLRPVAGAIAAALQGAEIIDVQCEHVDYARDRGVFHCPALYVLSEHYLSRPLRFGPDALPDAPLTGEADMILQPPMTLVNYQNTVGIAVIGHMNSGKSWIIHLIRNMLLGAGVLERTIAEDRLPGTFGYETHQLPPEVLQQIRQKIAVEVRILEVPNRTRLGEQLALTE